MRHFSFTFLSALILAFMALPSTLHADVIVAKDTVTGTVIGRDKQPVPGAKVEIVGQPYSAYTDLDGRFNIKCDQGAKKVLVTYPKLRDVKKKIARDMTVRIGRSWKQVPEHYQWFVGGNLGVGITTTYFDNSYSWANSGLNDPYGDRGYYYEESFLSPSISVMAGRVKAVGWYVKGFLNFPMEGLDYHFEKATAAGAILGGMVRLGCPLHLYLGGGFSYFDLSKTPSRLYYEWGWQIDMGLLFRIKDNYGINWSMNLGNSREDDNSTGSLMNLGFVYFFNK